MNMNMNIKHKLTLYLVLCVIQYLLDIETVKECTTNQGRGLLFIHDMFSMYLFIGGILFNPVYHLVFTLGIMLQWAVYGGCTVTKYNNELCGFEKDRCFNDVFFLMNIASVDKVGDYRWELVVAIIIIIFYDLIYIWQNRTNLSPNVFERLSLS